MARRFCVAIGVLVLVLTGAVRAADEAASAAIGADAYAKAVARAIDYLQKGPIARRLLFVAGRAGRDGRRHHGDCCVMAARPTTRRWPRA